MQPRSPARAVRARLTPWAVVSVQDITPAVEPNFQEVAAQLREAIAADEAADLLNAAIGIFEDARAGGAAVADAARQAGLAVEQVPAVEAGGRARDGAPIEALVGHEEALQAAFETPEGEASDFLPVGDADVVVSVDRIFPESVRPLSEVRADLSVAWIARERGRLLRELGSAFVASVRSGASFAEAARTHRFTIRARSVESNREMAQQLPAGGLPEQIFAASEGDVVSATTSDGGSVLAAQVERINRPDPALAQAEVEAYRAQFQEGLAGSVAEAIQNQILAQARVTRNEAVLAARFNAGGQDAEAQ
jgi:peptidyl-prolyl cis-trans isomerase D